MPGLSDLRHLDFIGEIDESSLNPNPLKQCESWINDAIKAEFYQPNAMVLATVDTENKPSARVVLLKEITAEGFLFYTNYDSRKGQDIAHNPYVALTLYWDKLERQIRIEGNISKIDAHTSDTYFASRPRDTQISAAASPQSQVIENREALMGLCKQLQTELEDKTIKRPAFWGGYIVKPQRIEFWQGRPCRLHDRLQYQMRDKQWIIQRLAP